MNTDASTLDTPIERATINELPVATLDAVLDDIRAKRLVIVQRIELLEGERHAKRLDAMSVRYVREYDRVRSALIKVDEALSGIETRITKLRVMEIELSD